MMNQIYQPKKMISLFLLATNEFKSLKDELISNYPLNFVILRPKII